MEKSIKLKKIKRAKKHGFMERTSSNNGKKLLKRRRNRKRAKLTI